MDTCLLCSLKQKCEGSSFVLFPTTPIIKDILIRTLWDAKVAHRVDSGVVHVDSSVGQDELSKALRQYLHEAELRDIRITNARGAEIMNAMSVLEWVNQADTSWFEDALTGDKFTTHFQPIVDRQAGTIHGHECLVRLQMGRTYNGGEIIDAAVSRGRIHVFDSYVRQLSVRLAAPGHVPGTKVFINFMPSSIYDPAFCMKSTLAAMSKTSLKSQDVVFEVVESEAVTDRKHLQKICAYYRERGFAFALDDVGTGSNSLQMVCDLRPDYMKIDKSLISGVNDPMYRATIEKIVELGDEFGVKVIAEGVEDEVGADNCSSMGIKLMQGYYFARPSPAMVTTSSSLVTLQTRIAEADLQTSPTGRSRTKKILQAS